MARRWNTAWCTATTTLWRFTVMNKPRTATVDASPDAVIAPSEIDSVALRRLIEEVQADEPLLTGAYNRTYNRHNR